MSEPRSPLFSRPSMAADLPAHLASLYNSPYAAAAVAAAVAGQGATGVPPPTFSPYGRAPGAAMFYPGMVGGEAWRRSPYLSQLDFCWPQGFRSLEAVVGPRTKAPREATSILKSWLNDHKDNPYPTKSEKMTLSIVTHMTLTQVSTWFANARRRIKKENKMTWTPKTRCGDRDGNSSNDEDNEKDYDGRPSSPFTLTPGMHPNAIRKESIEYGITNRCHSLSDAGSSSSHSISPNSQALRSNPVFRDISRMRSSYYNANPAASFEEALRQQMLSKHQIMLTQNLAQREQGIDLAKSTKSKEMELEVNEKRPSPPALARKRFVKQEEFVHSEPDEPLSPDRKPFVNLEGMKDIDKSKNHEDTPPFDKGDRGCENNEKTPNYRADSSNGPSHMPHNTTPNSNEDMSPKEEKNYTRPSSIDSGFERKTPEASASDRIPTDSTTRDPVSLATNLITKSAVDGKQDALSCWIRDFQQLVASGQELKAKQALATALAVAAKAGAYSNTGRPHRFAPYYRPTHLPPQERSQKELFYPRCVGLSPQVDRSRLQYQTPEKQCEQRSMSSTSTDDAITSSDSSQRRGSSPETPPMSAVRIRSPYRSLSASPDNMPMNLTKSSAPSKDWKHGHMLATDDTLIEV
uniref:uncharacterized protein LOC120341644 n=1 Tax=Styela clava TaxID=7725 RepID=UPI00193A0FFE|nr:uncharacterized protein LOC120341644 [Styela clava]